MVDIRPSRPGENPAQKALWKTAFGDEDRLIDWFYDCCMPEEDMLLLLEDGRLASMLALLPVSLSLPGGVEASGRYVYALATDPSMRGKGYGRQLLHYVDGFLSSRGSDCVTVVPAEPSLHKFFATVAFCPAFSTRKLELLRDMVGPARAEDGLTEAEPQEYGRLRRALLSDTAAVHYDQRLLRFQQGMSRMSGGGLYKITVDGVEGCAAAEYVDRHSVLCKELLIPSQHLARAVARLAERLPADRYHVRTPAGWEGLPGSYNQAFGMVKWYDREKRALWERTAHGYMGLGFD